MLLIIFLFNFINCNELVISEKANYCPEHWLDANSVYMGCLLINRTVPMSWLEANKYCQSVEEAVLIEIHTPEQLDFIRMELNTIEEYIGAANYWTGGTDIGREGKWFWISSLSIVEDFAAGILNQRFAANCHTLVANYDYSGGDIPCDHPLYPICQKIM